jgi:WD40 repeat protein
MMATASLDGFIRIWNLEDYRFKTQLEDLEAKKQSKAQAGGRNIHGVRTMSYTPAFGGFLVSAGYHSYISVWSPDSSLSKAYLGKLEGHSGIVVSCKIFPNSTNCISVDDKFNIRLWELRTFLPIQTIRNEA